MKQDYPFDLYRLYDTDYPISIVFTIDTIKWRRNGVTDPQVNHLFNDEQEAKEFQHTLKQKYLEEELKKEKDKWNNEIGATIVISEFSKVDVTLPFFDSFRKAYPTFNQWFEKHPERMCLLYSDDLGYHGFLAYKEEKDVLDTYPNLLGSWIKICSIKADPTGKGIGNVLLSKLLEIYPKRNFYLTTKEKSPSFCRWRKKNDFDYWGTYKDENVYVLKTDPLCIN